MTRSIGEAFARGQTNFAALRLLAALLVLLSHAWPLTASGPDPLSRATAGLLDGGSLGVAIFFVISGFLVARSVLARDPAAYLRARLLRVLPALALAVLVQTFVIGLLCTELPWTAYLVNRQTFDWLRNATVFDLRPSLPSVFAFNPYPVVVNGSLWTLPIECAFYLALPLVALLGGLRRQVAGALAALSLLAAAAAGRLGFSWAVQGPFLLWEVPLFPALQCLVPFLFGAALFVHRAEVPLSRGLAGICLIALYASAGSPGAPIVLQLTLPYLVLFAALARPGSERVMARLGDLSYGAYLYAFPVEQALVLRYGGHIAPLGLALRAAPIVLACAGLSWHVIERPALRLKAWKQEGKADGRRDRAGTTRAPGGAARGDDRIPAYGHRPVSAGAAGDGA